MPNGNYTMRRRLSEAFHLTTIRDARAMEQVCQTHDNAVIDRSRGGLMDGQVRKKDSRNCVQRRPKSDMNRLLRPTWR